MERLQRCDAETRRRHLLIQGVPLADISLAGGVDEDEFRQLIIPQNRFETGLKLLLCRYNIMLPILYILL